VVAAGAGGAEQQFAHPPFPLLALGAQEQQLGGGQADGAGLGAGQLGAYWQPGMAVASATRSANRPGQPCPGGAGQCLHVLAGGASKTGDRGPAFKQAEEYRRAQIRAGDVHGGGEDREQVGAQPVADAALVAGGAFVVACDRAQFGAHLAVRDQLPQVQVGIQGQQAADPGVFSVVFLLRRPAAAAHQVRIDRQRRHGRHTDRTRFHAAGMKK
jgi:hypothetical protein